MFQYFVYAAACATVEIDVLTGELQVWHRALSCARVASHRALPCAHVALNCAVVLSWRRVARLGVAAHPPLILNGADPHDGHRVRLRRVAEPAGRHRPGARRLCTTLRPCVRVYSPGGRWCA
jgi:hypothetical protein